MSDFLVIGGGVMGLLLSRHLLQAGASVTLVEAGQCGREASWAGGGIVSPLYPWRYGPAVTALARPAATLFPPLCQALLEETGIDPEYTPSGLLMLEAPDSAPALAWAATQGVDMQALDATGLQACEPACANGFVSGVWMPGVAQVRNPRLMQALLAANLRQTRFRVRDFEPVLSVDGAAGCVTTPRGRLQAGTVVACAGAWSGRLLAGKGVSLPVRPVCGQMLLYRVAPGSLQRIVLHDGHYLIPRRDGHLLAGSTLEERGFDIAVTEAARALLQAAAERMLPGLRGMAPVRQWAGLRPGSPDGVPCMGALPGGRLWVCAGHFRNGLVLAPASASLMADLLLGRPPTIDPSPYAPAAQA